MKEEGKLDLGLHTNAGVHLCVHVFVNVCKLARVYVNTVCESVLVTVPVGMHVCACVCVCVCASMWLMGRLGLW